MKAPNPQSTAARGAPRGRPLAIGVQTPAPSPAPNPHFARIGGEAVVARLVDRFYGAMERLPEAATIRAMHPRDLAASREKLLAYLVGWMGGPPRYLERHGHPRLRLRHLPFSIGEAERKAWLQCMDCALNETLDDPALKAELRQAFARVAASMRNR